MNIPPQLKDHWIKKFALHVLTGGISVLFHYSCMWLLLKGGATPIIASSSGFILGATVRFLTAHFVVFEPAASWIRALPKFLLWIGFQGIGNAGFLEILITFKVSVWIAQFFVTGFMTVLTFLMYRVWVFR